jgi:peptidoglycan/LPS O-acetylase OafA/YrhL
VTAFFVLSGFLITWLLLREQERTERIDIWRFYVRRGLRIFPAFYAYWLISVALLWGFGKTILWPQFIASAAYLTNYYHAVVGHQTSLVAHTWSLSVEEQFYLLWPVTAVCLLKSPQRMSQRLLWLIAGVVLWRCIGRFVLHLPEVRAYETLDMRADDLLIGCWLAVALKRELVTPCLRAITASAWLPLIPIVLLVASDRLQARGVDWRDSVGAFVDPWLVAILLVQLIALSQHRAWSWLSWRPVVLVGQLSYSIYLYHNLVLFQAMKFLPKHGVIRVIGSGLIVVTVGMASYMLVERPFLKLKSRFHV